MCASDLQRDREITRDQLRSAEAARARPAAPVRSSSPWRAYEVIPTRAERAGLGRSHHGAVALALGDRGDSTARLSVLAARMRFDEMSGPLRERLATYAYSRRRGGS